MNWKLWLLITEILFSLCGVSHGIEVPACRVTVPDAAGNVRSHGSGVLVATDEQSSYVLTNAHVVRDGRGEAELSFPASPVRPGRVIAADEKWDVAIIQTDPCKSDPPPIAIAPLQRGDKLMAGGFGREGRWRDMVGQVSSFYGPVGGGEFEMFEMSGGQARQGDSGGPIANERGELVGLIWGSSNGTSMGTPITKAVDLCQSYGICVGQQCQPPRARIENRPILGGQRIIVTQPPPKPIAKVVPLKPVAPATPTPGTPGPPGPPGKDGRDGKDAAGIDDSVVRELQLADQRNAAAIEQVKRQSELDKKAIDDLAGKVKTNTLTQQGQAIEIQRLDSRVASVEKRMSGQLTFRLLYDPKTGKLSPVK